MLLQPHDLLLHKYRIERLLGEGAFAHVGDVGLLRLEVRQETAEGLQIITRDVGMVRSAGPIGQVSVEGDAGAVIARGAAGRVEVTGDVGLVRPAGAEPRRCPSCGLPLAGPQGGQQFCEHCGARLG
jgi:hypothetical protein